MSNQSNSFVKQMATHGYHRVATVLLVFHRNLALDMCHQVGTKRLGSLVSFLVQPASTPFDYAIQIGWQSQRKSKGNKRKRVNFHINPLQGQLFAFRERSPYAGIITPTSDSGIYFSKLETQELWVFYKPLVRKTPKSTSNIIQIHDRGAV